MIKVQFKGFIEKVGEIETAKSTNKFQRVVFRVPGYTDEFGEKKSEDEFFEVMIFGQKKIEEIWSKHDDRNPSKKAEVSCFLNGRSRKESEEEDARVYYNAQLSVKEIKFI